MDRPSVAVCIATFRRPDGLRRLLQGLKRIEFRPGAQPDVHVVVVDNDPDGSARDVCDAARGWLRWPLHYHHETRRGLSYVRNRQVAEGRRLAELLAFIDDDEIPDERWLSELLAVQARFDADVVLGPALRRFEGDVPAWIQRGKFFDDPRHPTGTVLEHGGIGNALVHTRVLAGTEAPFDDRFALAGGEDTMFFLRLSRSGKRIVWADDAVIYEYIPPSRTRAGWVLRRVYRTANTWGLCERELAPSAKTGLLRAAKGVARIAYGALLLPAGALFGRHVAMRGLWYMCLGAGHVTGTAGFRFHEYRSTKGR